MNILRDGLMLISILALPFVAAAQQESSEQTEVDSAAVHSFKQTLSTDAYAGILKAMITPETLQNPIAICAQCHAGEDMARYTKTLGPMMQMINPVNWVNPMAYVNMGLPMVDPRTYAEWYEAYVKKYGALLGYDQDSGAAESPTSD